VLGGAAEQRDGVAALFCTSQVQQLRGRLYYGLYVYYLSKYYELLDTIILVLKKVRSTCIHRADLSRCIRLTIDGGRMRA